MVSRKEIMQEVYRDMRFNEGYIEKKIYGEYFRVTKEKRRVFKVDYYGIHFRFDKEKKEVTELEIESYADIDTSHGSLQDLLSLFNEIVTWGYIWVNDGRIVDMSNLRGFRHSEKVTWNRKSNEFKRLYSRLNNMIPKSNNHENYRRWISKPLREFRKFVNNDKLVQRRVNRRRMEVLE